MWLIIVSTYKFLKIKVKIEDLPYFPPESYGIYNNIYKEKFGQLAPNIKMY